MRLLLTIGHSNHSLETFLGLLGKHEVELVIDVRSQPYSRYSPQFKHEALQAAVESAGKRYLFMGNQLGGRPKDRDCYDAEGKVLYDRLQEKDSFMSGIERLIEEMDSFRVCLMCAEEDPGRCHRYLLISQVLSDRGIELLHIRGDGTLETQADVLRRTGDRQLTLL